MSKNKNKKVYYSGLHNRILSSFHIKVTFLRLKILAYAMSRKEPFSVDNVLDALRDTGIHFTTIYRNISLFKEKGVLQEVDMRRESIFYEYNGNNHHHHLICTECGFIEDFHICGADNLAKEVLKHSKQFSKITDHSFEMFGLCKKCK